MTPDIDPHDLELFDRGGHRAAHRFLGARLVAPDRARGAHLATWAPAARAVHVMGDWNGWSRDADPLTPVGHGVWAGTIAPVREGHRYKFAVTGPDGSVTEHADPYATRAEPLPGTASVITRPRHRWGDSAWLRRRAATDPGDRRLSIYEVHLGSWRRDPERPGSPLGFRELAEPLADHVSALGFTHVELLPVMAHPFGGSWGYQVTSYFAPTPAWGSPDDLRHLIDHLHRRGIGVILDWVPGHFPKDDWALGRFDGTPLYEHPDPRRGEHPDWGTFIFDYGRGGVRSFLLSNACWWLDEFHADGLRVDAVASMLYLDYSRPEGAWEPNVHGGRENLEAIDFLRDLNRAVHDGRPGVLCIAEESTAWPAVTGPVTEGGLGFDRKWNLGWMHDTLHHLAEDPVHRRHHHGDLTFGLTYAFSERFVLPLSHDEVVHGKGSLLTKISGDRGRQLATLRALYAWMWAHPGDPLVFMGAELAQVREWDHDGELDWQLLAEPAHAGVRRLLADLNTAAARPAIWSATHDPAGFGWIEVDNADENTLSFLRLGRDGSMLVCATNLSPVPRHRHRIGLPIGGAWREVINTDAAAYGGAGLGNLGAIGADGPPALGQPCSAEIVLPPLSTLWFEPG